MYNPLVRASLMSLPHLSIFECLKVIRFQIAYPHLIMILTLLDNYWQQLIWKHLEHFQHHLQHIHKLLEM